MTRALLLVDDDDANLVTLSALFEDERFDVDTARSCAEARGRLASGRTYAAVLLDGTLRDGSGLDLVPLIRTAQPGASILLVSGSIRDVPTSARVDAVMPKGNAFEDLLALVERLLAE